jgi:hypothetical protein
VTVPRPGRSLDCAPLSFYDFKKRASRKVILSDTKHKNHRAEQSGSSWPQHRQLIPEKLDKPLFNFGDG